MLEKLILRSTKKGKKIEVKNTYNSIIFFYNNIID